MPVSYPHLALRNSVMPPIIVIATFESYSRISQKELKKQRMKKVLIGYEKFLTF